MNFTDEELIQAFFEIEKLNRRFSERRYGENPLMKGQFLCLLTLQTHETMKQTDLATKLGIRPTSVSEILFKLEQQGLINRHLSPADKRIHLVSLTDAGRERAALGRKKSKEYYTALLADLSPAEKDSLYTLLSKIRKNLIAITKEDTTGEN